MVNYSISYRTKKIVYENAEAMWKDRLDGRLRKMLRFFDVVFDGIEEDANTALNDLGAMLDKRLVFHGQWTRHSIRGIEIDLRRNTDPKGHALIRRLVLNGMDADTAIIAWRMLDD